MNSKPHFHLQIAAHFLNHLNDGWRSFHAQNKHDHHDGDEGSHHELKESGLQ